MKILALAGSPHRPSNSEELMRVAIEGASQQPQVEIASFQVARMRIWPCRACGGCSETGLCVIRDDMQQLYPLLRGAERLIIASPIFFGSVTAWLKAVFDRCQACWSEKYLMKRLVQPRPPGRKGLFISTCGTRIPTMFDGGLAVVRPVFHVLEVELSATVFVHGLDSLGNVWSRPETLEQARAAGRRLAAQAGEVGA
jgi:putative NADPH-quinone reductase